MTFNTGQSPPSGTGVVKPITRVSPNKTYGKGRICTNKECNTELRETNKYETCGVHSPLRFPRVRGKKTEPD